MGKYTLYLGDSLKRIKEINSDTVALTCTCYDDKTKVLTKEGFKYFKDLLKSDLVASLNKDTDELEYTEPIEIQKSPYKGPLFKFKGESIDLAVTPNHNMYISRPKKQDYNLVTAEDMINLAQWNFKKNCKWVGVASSTFRLPGYIYYNADKTGTTKTNHKNIKKLDMNQWLTFLGYFISEGNAHKDKNCNRVSLYQNPGAVLEKMKKVLSLLGFKYREIVKVGKQNIELRISDVQLMTYLLQLGKTSDKKIPNELLDLPTAQLKYLFDALMEGDGSRDGHIYTTTSSQLSEQFLELLLKIGLNGSIKIKNKRDSIIDGRGIKKENLKDCYTISINRRKLTPIYHNQNTSVLDYNGVVYCCSVPNRTLCVQRNGKSVWCGNSPPYFNAKEYNGEDDNVGNNKSYQAYLDKIEELLIDTYRITKPGGIVVWNTSPVLDNGKRYGIPFHTNQIFEDIGFEFLEDIVWCVDENTLMLTDTGETTSIKNMDGKCGFVLSNNNDRLISEQLGIATTGKNKLFSVVTNKELLCTAEHRFLTYDGEHFNDSMTKHLTTDDYIVHAFPEVDTSNTVGYDEARLIGYICGDGYIYKNETLNL